MNVVDVPCPKCGVPAGRKCRAVKSGGVTGTHQVRYDVLYDAEMVAHLRFRASVKHP